MHHGAKPFLVTCCREDGVQTFWEWDVDPLTRCPIIPQEDLDEIAKTVFHGSDGWLVLQNAKFDFAALGTIGMWDRVNLEQTWKTVTDTLMAGHLLWSNKPHDLTSMALEALRVDIDPYERAVKRVCDEARRMARSKYPTWRIAKQGLEEMPSAKETVWKNDMWLPRALAKELGYPADHEWNTVVRDYANADSAVTMALWKFQQKEIVRRGLWPIYKERLKLLPIVYDMEKRGVTLDAGRLEQQVQEYRATVYDLETVMKNIAKGYPDPTDEDPTAGYDLVLPKAGNNHSLTHFCFSRPVKDENGSLTGVDKFLDLPVVAHTETGNPSLAKGAIETYLATLPHRSLQLKFIECLGQKRSRDTAIAYMESYQRFWKCKDDTFDTYLLHPSLNPTGTDTLRFSSQNPNAQNISKKEGFNIRYAFGPGPGREWWSLDAKNIELRLPAYESQEADLIALFERPNDAPYYGSTHLLNFHTVYPDLWDAAVKEVGYEKAGPYCKKKYASTWYQWCKNGGFAVQYGAVDKADGTGTADQAFHKPGSHSRLKERFGKLEKLNRHWIRYAEKHGYVETMPDRSVDPTRGYPILCTRTEYGKILETVPLNYHIQSTAMWWTMMGMIRCFRQLQEWKDQTGFDGFMTMQVHDELVFDFPAGKVHPTEEVNKVSHFKRSNLWRVRRLAQLMSVCGDDLGVPTPVGIEYHADNWAKGVVFA